MYVIVVAGIVQSVYQLATGWTVWNSKAGEGEIFRAVQTDPEVNPAFCAMGTESLSRKQSSRGVMLTAQFLLAPRLSMSRTIYLVRPTQEKAIDLAQRGRVP
jgi:hypothetical protein